MTTFTARRFLFSNLFWSVINLFTFFFGICLAILIFGLNVKDLTEQVNLDIVPKVEIIICVALAILVPLILAGLSPPWRAHREVAQAKARKVAKMYWKAQEYFTQSGYKTNGIFTLQWQAHLGFAYACEVWVSRRDGTKVSGSSLEEWKAVVLFLVDLEAQAKEEFG
jgi:hypothetical protein